MYHLLGSTDYGILEDNSVMLELTEVLLRYALQILKSQFVNNTYKELSWEHVPFFTGNDTGAPSKMSRRFLILTFIIHFCLRRLSCKIGVGKHFASRKDDKG